MKGETIMSTTMSDNTITVREFASDDVNYRHNDDLPLQLRQGKNEYGSLEEAVLVKINMDGMEYSNVEVYARSSRNDADVIEAAIASLIVARDALRSMTVAA